MGNLLLTVIGFSAISAGLALGIGFAYGARYGWHKGHEAALDGFFQYAGYMWIKRE